MHRKPDTKWKKKINLKTSSITRTFYLFFNINFLATKINRIKIITSNRPLVLHLCWFRRTGYRSSIGWRIWFEWFCPMQFSSPIWVTLVLRIWIVQLITNKYMFVIVLYLYSLVKLIFQLLSVLRQFVGFYDIIVIR